MSLLNFLNIDKITSLIIYVKIIILYSFNVKDCIYIYLFIYVSYKVLVHEQYIIYITYITHS